MTLIRLEALMLARSTIVIMIFTATAALGVEAPKGEWTAFEDKGGGPGISFDVPDREGGYLNLACTGPGRVEIYVATERPAILPIITYSSGQVRGMRWGRKTNYEDAYFGVYAQVPSRVRVLTAFRSSGVFRASGRIANATTNAEMRAIEQFFANCG
jgi:hypothetical protein